MKKCNVRITSKHFHELHHALGYPWPEEIMGETYRNHFATDAGSDTADCMRASPHWTGGTEKFGMTFFHVTQDGKRALLEHMRDSVDLPARFEITYHGHNWREIVAARSRSAAKYGAYLDADSGDTFGEFVRRIKSVRLLSRAQIGGAA
ncbi:hypothetical protein IQ24_01803 [Paracoccus sulfuroxidans]|uniref:Uncharacterized protein n=2 Tax=Paracoccus sulfuroxidans TaxID=384678 RepID=A0A562NQ24_9RHOB|nr:hypothetical protein psul1_p56 [Paracoccus phage vB_PsuS_Psul1]TWI34288.1 hypothetical protein IQ24_01803 [Paracoccus sulfuroxidans]